VRPSKQAEMISDKYLCRERVQISCRKTVWPAALMAVRRRLMKAVFFFMDESSEP
jgi:hypothetical protein